MGENIADQRHHIITQSFTTETGRQAWIRVEPKSQIVIGVISVQEPKTDLIDIVYALDDPSLAPNTRVYRLSANVISKADFHESENQYLATIDAPGMAIAINIRNNASNDIHVEVLTSRR